MISDQVKQHLQWIIESAKRDKLAVLEVCHRETGEARPALVVVLEPEDTGILEFYPLGFVTEDIGQLMAEWDPPGEISNETRTSGAGAGPSN